MSTIHLTKRGKSTSLQQNRKQLAQSLASNERRPKHGGAELTHAAILARLLKYMRPELGNLSWVSHGRIAKDLGIRREAVHYHLLAAEMLGEIRVRYTCPKQADEQISKRYKDYLKYTKGKTFAQLVASEPGHDRRLNFYTIDSCETLLTKQAYADWMVEVIRLCASQRARNVKTANALVNEHSDAHEVAADAFNCAADHTVEAPAPQPPEAAKPALIVRRTAPSEPAAEAFNCAADRTENLLPKKEEDGYAGKVVASPEKERTYEENGQKYNSLVELLKARYQAAKKSMASH